MVLEVPRSLGAAAGDLIHLQRDDGETEVVGRVVGTAAQSATTTQLQLELMSPAIHQSDHGWMLEGAPRAVGLEAVVRLLLSPDALLDEARLAREAICPTIEQHLLPTLMSRLWPELSDLLQNPNDEDVRLLQQAIAETRGQLAPLEAELVERLSRQAWEIVGLRGMAAGFWRTDVRRRREYRQGFSRLVGASHRLGRDRRPRGSRFPLGRNPGGTAAGTAGRVDRVLERTSRRSHNADDPGVVASQSGLAQAARLRWGPRLYERVIQPAWVEGEAEVIQAVERYTQDFTSRRLLTPRGAPRLLLAHACRSELGVSAAPLLVLAPLPTEPAGEFRYQPLVP